MDQTLSYDLAFMAPERRPYKAPEIVFIIDKQHLPEAASRLKGLLVEYHWYIAEYLVETNADFTLPETDLFGKTEFGFGRCGYCTTEGTQVYMRLPMRPYPWATYCTLTIFLLTRAFSFPFTKEASSNRTQDVHLHTRCERNRLGGWGHGVGGWLSENVVNWLKTYAKDKIQTGDRITAAPMHEDVIKALQTTWSAICQPNAKEFANQKHVRGWIRDSGAFTMICFGNACDLSVYPDASLYEGCEWTELSCHNLDTKIQQLTLLAGLAKLCQLVRESS